MRIVVYGINQNLSYMLKCGIHKYTQIVALIKAPEDETNISLKSFPIIELKSLKEYDYDYIVIASNDYNKAYEAINSYDIINKNVVNFNNLLNIITITKLRLLYNGTECMKYVDYMEKHGISVFNDEFTEKYNNTKDIECYFDERVNLYYVIYYGKKMYMSRRYTNEEQVKAYVSGIMMEQDIRSPHTYLSDTFYINDGDVVIDAGVAEGNFALSIIDKVSKIYLIECDDDWNEALRHTFSPYADKVVFINKFLSDIDDDFNISIDNLIQSIPVDAIKMDIEGAEIKALIGAEKTIRCNPGIKLAICCYHKHNDEIIIKSLLKYFGVESKCSDGHMLFIWENNFHINPEFRHGIVWSISN